jgi:hypothetical protein
LPYQIQHLFAQFAKDRLRRHGMLTRNVSILIEVHPAKAFPIRNILLIFNRMALELEKMHPRIFANPSVPDHDVPTLVENIGRNLFRQDEITWAKIISWFTLVSAIVVECVKTGQHDIVQHIIDVACIVLSEEAGIWIENQGGLNALSEHIKPIRSDHISFLGLLQVMVGFLFATHWLWIFFKYLGTRFGYFL